MLSLVQEAITSKNQESFELDKKIDFFSGELDKVTQEVDTVYVPYLLGVNGGIEEVDEIIRFIKKALLLTPKGHLIVTPSLNKKEFHLAGQRYFTTTCYQSIKDIPEVSPAVLYEDTQWFKTQGLCVFRREETSGLSQPFDLKS